MAVSKAQQKAVARYVRDNYDELKVRMPKGYKQEIAALAASRGQSVNAFIREAVEEHIARITD